MQDPELAMQYEGEIVYPVCFRDSSEIRVLQAQADPVRPGGPELEAQ